MNGGQGGESEELLGRWRRSRGVGDEILDRHQARRAAARPGTSYTDNPEGLSAKVIREAAERSRERLGMDRSTCSTRTSRTGPWSRGTPWTASRELVAEGTVGCWGRATTGLAGGAGPRARRRRRPARVRGAPVPPHLLHARFDVPSDLDPDGDALGGRPGLASYLRAEPALALVAYSPLIRGGYTQADRPGSGVRPAQHAGSAGGAAGGGGAGRGDGEPGGPAPR